MDIIKQVHVRLEGSKEKGSKKNCNRGFKKGEKHKGYGLKVPAVHRVAKEEYSAVKNSDMKELLAVCGELMASGYIEERFVADDWLEWRSKDFTERDFKFLEKCVHEYVSNWAECDTLCNHAVGSFVMKYPVYIKKLKKWAHSKNRWTRRAACVSLIIPARRGMFLSDIFGIADIVRDDTDDMVQKGYGWMLKEASKQHQKEVFDYVMKHRAAMPRTALRYAIEKMPDNLKKKAMSK
ncbi:MAG: DNA alkylation repair protein [Spirochaetia bacterium]|nr:DNA alkylation repair protein [Spirochaetia bacterium]